MQQCPEAVGIGEECRHKFRYTGSTYAGKSQQINAQGRFLRLYLQLAKRENKVLVLHVLEKGTGKAALEFLKRLKELNMIDQPIHRHSFVGREKEYKDHHSTQLLL